MFDAEELEGPERELVAAMRKLEPAAAGGRERLLFEAGRQRERRTLAVWKGVAGALCAGLAVSLAARPAPRTVTQVVYVERPAPAAPTAKIEVAQGMWAPPETVVRPFAYLELREAVMSRGLGALPTSPKAGAPGDLDRFERLLGFRPGDPEAAAIRQRLNAEGGRL